MQYIPTTYTALCGAEAAAAVDPMFPTVVSFHGLTPCCKAHGKGDADASTGVVCRACYREVSAKYGTAGWESIREAARDAKCSAPNECADYILSVLEDGSRPVGQR